MSSTRVLARPTKGRSYPSSSDESKVGAEAQEAHKKRKLSHLTSDKDREEKEDSHLNPLPSYTDSDSETSEEEGDEPPQATPSKPKRRPPRVTRIPSPSPSSSSTPSSPAAPPRPRSTVTVAVPGSIIANAQSPELRTYLAGQLGRAFAVFCVDHVVVFRDSSTEVREGEGVEGEWRGPLRGVDPSVFLARLLQYLECPQYLRKFLFPVHPDLRYAGLLNPLEATHHVRATENSPWREGVVVNRPAGGGKGGGGGGEGLSRWANVGLPHDIQLDRSLPPLTRVTVDVSSPPTQGRLLGRVVSPDRPREAGLYWGYEVDLCPSFSDVFTSCKGTDDGVYDLTVGTSERGRVIQGGEGDGEGFELPPYRHLLVVFGGLNGLEEACAGDERMKETRVEDRFDLYLNTCAGQGSRTIRTEEAILITLSLLRPHILTNDPKRARKR